MSEQIIISVSREYGTGGREIATDIAREYSLDLYDRNILEEIFREKNHILDLESLREHDEKPKNVLTSRSVRGHSSSMEENIAQMQFEFLREKADSGKSFVVLGRCSETVLAKYDGLISIFIKGETEVRKRRVMDLYHLSENDAMSKIKRHDRYRKQYHNLYSEFKWGDLRNYDLCINSSLLGIEGTVKTIRLVVDMLHQNKK